MNLSGTWLSHGSYRVYMAVTGSTSHFVFFLEKSPCVALTGQIYVKVWPRNKIQKMRWQFCWRKSRRRKPWKLSSLVKLALNNLFWIVGYTRNRLNCFDLYLYLYTVRPTCTCTMYLMFFCLDCMHQLKNCNTELKSNYRPKHQSDLWTSFVIGHVYEWMECHVKHQWCKGLL